MAKSKQDHPNMTNIKFTSEITVKPIETHATDYSVVDAARVSVTGMEHSSTTEKEREGLINFLMKNRHGTPFEHNSFTFFVDAPIFVFREFHRHRIGWSYNETSGRYKELEPKFYIPPDTRNLVQVGKPGAYDFVPGTPEQYQVMRYAQIKANSQSYAWYEDQLNQGISKEVARMVLPVSIYSSMFATCNARSLMAFLSLRQQSNEALFISRPMKEINIVADQIESIFMTHMPLTHAAYVAMGRVCP